MQKKLPFSQVHLATPERPVAFVFGKAVKLPNYKIICAGVILVLVLGVLSCIIFTSEKSSQNEKAQIEESIESVDSVDSEITSYDSQFPETVKLNDEAGHVLSIMFDIEPYREELSNLIEGFSNSKVKEIKLYSFISEDLSIQYLYWIDEEDTLKRIQFASSTITESLRSGKDSVENEEIEFAISQNYNGGAIIFEK